MTRGLVQRVWNADTQAMVMNAASMVGATAVTSVLGFFYWWVATRMYLPEAVGFASASIAAMMLLGSASMLGFGTLLMGELPRHRGNELSLISTALIVTGGVGGILGVLFALVMPLFSRDFQSLRATWENTAIFAFGVILTTVSLVLDKVFIGLLRGGLQLWRNTIFAATKLAALALAAIWLSARLGLTIYATWTMGNLISLIVLAVFLAIKRVPLKKYSPQWSLLRGLGRAALGHHGLNLSLQLAALALPIVVTLVLSATANAYFYAAWLIAGFVFTGSYSLSLMLYATSAADAAALRRKVRFTLAFAAGLDLIAGIVLLISAGWILRIFGHVYAAEATWTLRVLGLGAMPLIIKDLYVAICRVRGQASRAALLIIVGTALELGMAAIGGYIGGLRGLSIGWLTGVLIEVALMVRPVYDVAALPLPWRRAAMRPSSSLVQVAFEDTPTNG
jgi:O-antigen/teichoic acid export membrane protein